MKTCKNCLWYDDCPCSGQRCEDYYPLIGGESVVRREYEEALQERCREYEEIVAEMND
jgi:hypothetical protein